MLDPSNCQPFRSSHKIPQAERRRAVFCHVYTALLDYFKALMTPYMSFMIQAFSDLLRSFAKSEEPDQELWGPLVQVLGKSFEVDDAGTIQTFPFYLILGNLAHHTENSILARRSSQGDL